MRERPTFAVAENVTGKISEFVGEKLGKACAVKGGDTATKAKARSLLLASTLSYGEMSNGASECYENVVRVAKAQATSFVAAKYGQSAAELCRHTAGAATNFGRAALTARRVVDPKTLIKSVAKHAVKESVKDGKNESSTRFLHLLFGCFIPFSSFGCVGQKVKIVDRRADV
jgi:hypothetical protein